MLPKFDGLTTYAIQSWCNLSLHQMYLLRRCLRAELGSTLFSVEYRVTQVVGLEHVVPQTCSYMYGTEKTEWSYNNVILVFTLWLNMKLAGPTEFKYDHIDITTSLDHGKGHSRITVTFIARWQIDNGEWNEDEYSCTIGNARCKKDNSEIIMNTFGPHLNNSSLIYF